MERAGAGRAAPAPAPAPVPCRQSVGGRGRQRHRRRGDRAPAEPGGGPDTGRWKEAGPGQTEGRRGRRRSRRCPGLHSTRLAGGGPGPGRAAEGDAGTDAAAAVAVGPVLGRVQRAAVPGGSGRGSVPPIRPAAAVAVHAPPLPAAGRPGPAGELAPAAAPADRPPAGARPACARARARGADGPGMGRRRRRRRIAWIVGPALPVPRSPPAAAATGWYGAQSTPESPPSAPSPAPPTPPAGRRTAPPRRRTASDAPAPPLRWQPQRAGRRRYRGGGKRAPPPHQRQLPPRPGRGAQNPAPEEGLPVRAHHIARHCDHHLACWAQPDAVQGVLHPPSPAGRGPHRRGQQDRFQGHYPDQGESLHADHPQFLLPLHHPPRGRVRGGRDGLLGRVRSDRRFRGRRRPARWPSSSLDRPRRAQRNSGFRGGRCRCRRRRLREAFICRWWRRRRREQALRTPLLQRERPLGT